MYRYFTIFIFLCVLLTTANGQSTALADSLMAAGDYDLAVVEYERCVYQAQSRQIKTYALRRKAECFKLLGNYTRAGDALERCAENYTDFVQLSLCRYLAGFYESAAFAANRCEMLCDTVGEDIYLIWMLALNEMSLYDSAHSVAITLAAKHLSATGVDISPIVDSLYSNTPQLKNERLAWYLSLLPGLGHAYAGEYGLGVAAFAMNAALLTFGVWQVFEGCYVTAYMGGAGLLSVTYPGAMRNAEYCVRKYNYKQTSAFNTAIRQVVMAAVCKEGPILSDGM